MVNLTRYPNVPSQVSNTSNPKATQFQWYEKTYTTTGPQEWITIPDISGVSVTLSVSASTGSIEYTNSPPDVVDTGSPVVSTWTPAVVSATTSAFLLAPTAIRVNVATGTSVTLSARC